MTPWRRKVVPKVGINNVHVDKLKILNFGDVPLKLATARSPSV